VAEEPFPIVDVSSWTIAADETAGAEEKYWIEEPRAGTWWLFKSVTIKDGHIHGEDWAEKTVSELAAILGIPCARVEMAEREGTQGCIGADLRPAFHELQHGQVLLEECRAPGYVHATGRHHPGHSLENIRVALEGVLPPPQCELGFAATAFDVFAGYLVLDAWVANRDRHDNNWAVLRPVIESPDPLRLCGSYDHANSLGFSLRAKRLQAELQRVTKWCEKGTAWRFDPGPSADSVPTLVELAVKALGLASSEARRYWRAQLQAIDHDSILELLERVPRMSDPARMFAGKVLAVNRRRVLDVCS
jgi:hypothetical protein